ncbi:hypothetical protein C9I92_13065 [Photobacterium ganghwense]|uniref:Lipoprotein n=1 Tax=Photobacterium ganghwense TaxID=320778 RepID=A0A0J1HJ39_9GAMM|nr:hypothetical protein [Photobacterium ganghwense]KLV11576.1 hypothetical protein ABT57_02260 [Photobacterium ganghwense]PSU08444.1 hypothetical protein C9I92_13065 [Photobacterium ganghwense]
MKKLIKKLVFLILISGSLHGYAGTKSEVMSLGFREKTKPLTLSTGEVIQLEGLAKIYATETEAWVLILNYRSDSLEPTELRKKAELIWPKFKPTVEKMGLRYAGIHAKKYPVENPTAETKFEGFNLILVKQSNDEWVFIDDVK